MIRVEISGIIKELESGRPLEGLYVKAHDKDLLFDDLLGSAFSSTDGGFRIISSPEDFRDFFEQKPDVYITVHGPDAKKLIHSTENEVRWNVTQDQFFDLRVPRKALEGIFSPPEFVLTGDDEVPRDAYDVGESLTIQARGLQPAQVYDIALYIEGKELLTSRLITNLQGERTYQFEDVEGEGEEGEVAAMLLDDSDEKDPSVPEDEHANAVPANGTQSQQQAKQ